MPAPNNVFKVLVVLAAGFGVVMLLRTAFISSREAPEIDQTAYASQLQALADVDARKEQLAAQLEALRDATPEPVLALQLELSDLLLRYTEQHPEVVAKKRQLAHALEGTSAPDPRDFERVMVAFSMADEEASAIRARLDEYERRLNHR